MKNEIHIPCAIFILFYFIIFHKQTDCFLKEIQICLNWSSTNAD